MWQRPLGAALLAAGLLAAPGARARAESYVSLYSGMARTRDSDLRVRRPGTDAVFGGVSWRDESFTPPLYYGVKVGGYLRSRPRWGLELDFTHYKVYARTERTVPVTGTWDGAPVDGSARLGERVQAFSISNGVNTLALNVLYRWPGRPTSRFPFGHLQPYVGGGPAYYILHPENTIGGERNDEKYESSCVGWQLLGGAHYGLRARTSLFVEAKYSSGSAKVNTAMGGRAETELRTWQGMVGIQYNL